MFSFSSFQLGLEFLHFKTVRVVENQFKMNDDEVAVVTNGEMDIEDSVSIATVNSSKSDTSTVTVSKKRKSSKKKSDGYGSRRVKKRAKTTVKEEEEEEYEVEMIIDHKVEDVSTCLFLSRRKNNNAYFFINRIQNTIWSNGKVGLKNTTPGFRKRTSTALI